MNPIPEGRLLFTFPAGCHVEKYDDSTFYRDSAGFQNLAQNSASDIIVITPANELWLIEIKDYRKHPDAPAEPKDGTLDIIPKLARKARDTLSALFAAQYEQRPHNDINNLALLTRNASKIRLAFHRELPESKSQLQEDVLTSDHQNATIKWRQAVRAVDPKAVICRMDDMPTDVIWTVTNRPNL